MLQRLVAASEKKRKMREKREQSNREYSSKVLASKDLHYLCIGINERGSICGLTAECQNKRGIASPFKDYASGNLHLAAGEESRW